MDLQLNGKTALVTGGSEGIGKGITLALAKEGVDVAICGRRKDVLEATASEIARATNRKIVAIPADLRKDADAKNFIAQSDVYQNCLLDYVRTQKEAAAEALKDKDNKDKKPFDPYIETQIQKQIDNNQAAKVRTGAEINAAVNDFKLAHPK